MKICEETSGWEKHNVGGEDYCFKVVGEFPSEQAKAVCETNGATLPLPTSSAQNEDFRSLVNSFGFDWIIIGITDSGSRFLLSDVDLRLSRLRNCP